MYSLSSNTNNCSAVVAVSIPALAHASTHALVNASAHLKNTVVVLAAKNSPQQSLDSIAFASAVAAPALPVMVIQALSGDLPAQVNAGGAYSVKLASPQPLEAGSTDLQVVSRIEETIKVLPLASTFTFFEYSGSKDAKSVLIVPGTAPLLLEEIFTGSEVGVLRVRVFRPWSNAHLLAALPVSAKNVSVLEAAGADVVSGSAFGTLFMDIAASLAGESREVKEIRVKGEVDSSSVIRSILEAAKATNTGAVSLSGDVELSQVYLWSPPMPRPT
ncbi:hypothetical protein BC830DRAFT_705927 [Chytriomyces sp. MP71]|nr:hypothetical protein BC830DRAFT_705927 [Chytriomyces sp. MP71]